VAAALGSCDILGLCPPQGEKWVGHSHRSGGATATLSIDASLPAIASFGVWDHMGSLQAYLDASVGPSADTLLFFEHLLTNFVSVRTIKGSSSSAKPRSGPRSALSTARTSSGASAHVSQRFAR